MKEMTIKRHALIRRAFKKKLGTMPVMRIYLELSEQFGLSDETIRQILGKKNACKDTIGENHQQKS